MVVDIGVNTLLGDLLITVYHRDEFDGGAGGRRNDDGVAYAVPAVAVGVGGEQRVAAFGFGDGESAEGGAVHVQKGDELGVTDPGVHAERGDEVEGVEVVSVAGLELCLGERGDVLLTEEGTQDRVGAAPEEVVEEEEETTVEEVLVADEVGTALEELVGLGRRALLTYPLLPAIRTWKESRHWP